MKSLNVTFNKMSVFYFTQHCIRDLVSSVAKQNDIPLNRETLDMFVLMVLYEACSPVSSSAAKTAVQLLFGRAHLVSNHFFVHLYLLLQ